MKKFSWKNLLLVGASSVLAATIAVGGTLAYLTSADSDVNVMTIGNVSIEQLEYERVLDENGDPVKGVEGTDFTADYGITESYKLKEFSQFKPALPAVYRNGTPSWDEFQQLWNGVGAPGSNDLFDDSMKNVVDKFVFVKNTGETDAFFRTIVLIEIPENVAESTVHSSFNANSRYDYNDDKEGSQNHTDSNKFVVYIDGVRYVAYTATHTEALKPGDVSRPSLLQVYLDPNATNEDCAQFGETWQILTLSQAVQSEGFADADSALDTAFGDVTEETVQTWFGSFAPTTVKGNNKQALIDAINNAEPGATLVLENDIIIDGYNATDKLVIDKPITIDLNGKTLTTECGWGGIDLKGGASIVNGTINHIGNTAAIKAFNVNRIENVTINVTETAGKTKGGIVVQNADGNCVNLIRNVTINGATNGIECYRSTNSPAIGVMDNVKINATQNGIYLNGAGIIGSIVNCDIYGGSHGINAYLANLWNIALDIENSKISGGTYGIDIWDEAKPNTGSTVTFNYDAATTFKGGTNNIKVTLQEEITCTINGETLETPVDSRQ